MLTYILVFVVLVGGVTVVVSGLFLAFYKVVGWLFEERDRQMASEMQYPKTVPPMQTDPFTRLPQRQTTGASQCQTIK
jgi:hypothetical protein